MNLATLEISLFALAAMGLVCTTLVTVYDSLQRPNEKPRAIYGLWLTWLLLTVAIAVRWLRIDHGPFVSMYEILASNLWSFIIFYLAVYHRMKVIRPTLLIFLVILNVMAFWMAMMPAQDPGFPATFNTGWLYVHIGFGKVFMGALVVATLLAFLIVLRQFLPELTFFQRLPPSASLSELAYRFVVFALIFDSLMLIGGAIWAQLAWGRYWFWDPLETWAFISWLMLGLAVHAKITVKPEPHYYALFIILVFVISFLTFFGLPFLNTMPHKGAV